MEDCIVLNSEIKRRNRLDSQVVKTLQYESTILSNYIEIAVNCNKTNYMNYTVNFCIKLNRKVVDYI